MRDQGSGSRQRGFGRTTDIGLGFGNSLVASARAGWWPALHGLACPAEGFGSVDGRDAGDGGDHHAREQLHGGYVALIKGSGSGRQDFENSQGAAVVAQRGNQDGADAQAAAAGEIDARIALGVVTQHDLAGADGFGGDAGIGLQADAKIGSSAAGAGAANDFVACTQGDGGAGGSGQVLCAFGDSADRGLEIKFSGVNFNFFGHLYGSESGGRVCGIRDAKLAALGKRGHARAALHWRRNPGPGRCGADRVPDYRVRNR